MFVHFILFVEDQRASSEFYSAVLELTPRLDVPGMTEFELSGGAVLGIMPYTSASRLLGLDHNTVADRGRVPQSEVYLMVDGPAAYHERSLSAGGREISSLTARDWGHTAAYSYDPDGHVLAFAEPTAI